MKNTLKYFILAFLLLVFAFSEAQKILTLDCYRITGFKRLRFHDGDEMKIKTHDKLAYSGKITLLDSAIEIEGAKLFLTSINKIYIDKSNEVTRKLSKFIFWCGAGFALLDTFNNTVNGDEIVQTRTIIAGSSLMLAGWLLKKIPVRKYKISRRKVLKILDVTITD